MSNTIVLQRGDSDKRTTWGGSQLSSAPQYTVTSLQTDLKAIGVYTDTIDGGFGKNTEKALKVFQWCLKNSSNVNKNGSLLKVTPSKATIISGKFDDGTSKKLKEWLTNKYQVTGDLVRIPTTSLSNIELGPSFRHIGKPIVSTTEFVISKAAFPMIKLLNETAKKHKITIKINQAFRLHGVKVTGAVVPPATRSQHLIGHSIDCNMVDGKSWNTSQDFKKKKQTANADKLIKEMTKAQYRWGGNFTKVDTPHFDKQLNAHSFDYDAKFYLNQKQISSGGPIEKQLIP